MLITKPTQRDGGLLSELSVMHPKHKEVGD